MPSSTNLPLAIALAFLSGGAAGGVVMVVSSSTADSDAPTFVESKQMRVHSRTVSDHSEALTNSPAPPPTSPARAQSLVQASPALMESPAEEDASSGQSLADSLARLERSYQDMLERTARLEADMLRAENARLTAEAQLTNTALAQAAQVTSSPPQLVQPIAAAEPTPVEQPDEVRAVTAPAVTAPAAEVTAVTQTNQTMIMSYTPVFIPVPSSGLTHGAPKTPPVSQTPASRPGTSPWAPIDMSKHHNPWAGSRLP